MLNLLNLCYLIHWYYSLETSIKGSSSTFLNKHDSYANKFYNSFHPITLGYLPLDVKILTNIRTFVSLLIIKFLLAFPFNILFNFFNLKICFLVLFKIFLDLISRLQRLIIWMLQLLLFSKFMSPNPLEIF